ncbi:MAG: hypothetical protein ABUT20_25615, partial [Bacteroidota bacterium]
MLHGTPRIYLCNSSIIITVLICLLVSSCNVTTVVKKYRPYKPFVFETKINVIGKYTSDEKKDLETRLQNQLDDSMSARTISKVLWSELRNPSSFDSASAGKSVLFMHLLMNKLGYFRDTIYYKTHVDTAKKKQYRVFTTFYVKPGKIVKIDSIVYNIKNPDLQRLTDSSMGDTYLKKNHSFSQDTIAAELDRLVEVYRNRGYLRITRDELVCGWDTLDASLLQPTFDPFEQLQQLQEIKEHRENPTVNLEIRLRPVADSSRLKKYYVGNITMYPDLSEDTVGFVRKEKTVQDIKMIYWH